ncbi:MAG: Mut7-C RNAse domain-containing protein [Pseudomonadota bacterium]
MATARFRFHGELEHFLPRERRGVAFAYACARAATLKNAIEALGVPHTEVALVLVNGERATLSRIVREGDAVEVYPWPARPAPAEPGRPEFVADAHLGGLARFLRMLGFDTVHEPQISDATIRRLAWKERRIVLTRDRELLKCREIARGCYVHARKPEAQLREVVERFGLAACARPFTLCLACNVALKPVPKAAVLDRLPAAVAASREHFMHCARCDRVYWEGSHYARMRAALARIMDGET